MRVGLCEDYRTTEDPHALWALYLLFGRTWTFWLVVVLVVPCIADCVALRTLVRVWCVVTGVSSDTSPLPTDTERPAARGWDSPPRGVDLGSHESFCLYALSCDTRTTDPSTPRYTNYRKVGRVRYITPWWLLPTQRHTPQSKPSWLGLPTPWLWEAVTHMRTVLSAAVLRLPHSGYP